MPSQVIERTLIDEQGSRTIKQTRFVGLHHATSIKKAVAAQAAQHGKQEKKAKEKRKEQVEKVVLRDVKRLEKAVKDKPSAWQAAVDRSECFKVGNVEDPLYVLPTWIYNRRLPRPSDLVKAPEGFASGGVIMDQEMMWDQFVKLQPETTPQKDPQKDGQKDQKRDTQKTGCPNSGRQNPTAPTDSARAVQSHRGIIPICPPNRPDEEDVLRACDYVKMILSIMTARDGQKELQAKDKPKKPRALRVVVGLDTEWQVKQTTKSTDDVDEEVPEVRDPSDVLNVSLALWLPDDPEQAVYRCALVNQHPGCHQKPGDPVSAFNFRQVMISVYEQVLDHFTLDDELRETKDVQFLLTGFFMGVDLSAMTGWNLLDMDLIVKGKHFVASARSYKLVIHSKALYDKQLAWRKSHKTSKLPETLKDTTLTLTFRDAGLLADKGGLGQTLAPVVGIEKLDTEEDDARMGKPIGYYKEHMQDYYRDCPERYREYVTRDAWIPVEYLRTFARVFKLDWSKAFSAFPLTTSAYAASLVAAVLKHDTTQSIFDPSLSLTDRRQDPTSAVRRDLLPLYQTARGAYYGGFNVAFGYLIARGIVVDMDLTSAYNTAGSLMPVPDYTAPRSSDLHDLGTKYVAIDYPKEVDFATQILPYLQKLSGFPFVLGAGTATIDMPEDCKLTMVPAQSPVYQSPAYVKHTGSVDTTLVDLIAAAAHGGKVMVKRLYVPAQSWGDFNAWGRVQLDLRAKRDEAKKLRNAQAKGSPAWLRYEAEQRLYKLVGNTVYGKSAQGIINKRVREYATNTVLNMPMSAITDPVIAGAYTAFTRLLAWYLYDAVMDTYGANCLPLNITTDGLTVALQPGVTFDFDTVHKAFLSHLTPHYRQRLAKIGASAGFERKTLGDATDTPTRFFNVRSRFNGTLDVPVIEALGGIRAHTYTLSEIWDALQAGTIWLPVREQRMTNITEMKHGSIAHRQGMLTTFPTLTRISLQYDCAYKPDAWLDAKWAGFGFTAVPFDTMEDHDTWKSHSKELTDRWNIARDKQRFEVYLETMEHYSFRSKKKLDDPYELSTMRELLTVSKAGSGYPTDQKLHDRYKRFKVAVRDDKPWPVCSMAIYDQNHDLD